MTITIDDSGGQPLRPLKFSWITGPFAVCKFAPAAPIPAWALQGDFVSVSRSTEELSIVCPADSLPRDVNSQHHWICFKLEGPFAFSQVGILSSFISPLSAAKVPIFAISTYDTDYVLVPEEYAAVALQTLQSAGHELSGD